MKKEHVLLNIIELEWMFTQDLLFDKKEKNLGYNKSKICSNSSTVKTCFFTTLLSVALSVYN